MLGTGRSRRAAPLQRALPGSAIRLDPCRGPDLIGDEGRSAIADAPAVERAVADRRGDREQSDGQHVAAGSIGASVSSGPSMPLATARPPGTANRVRVTAPVVESSSTTVAGSAKLPLPGVTPMAPARAEEAGPIGVGGVRDRCGVIECVRPWRCRTTSGSWASAAEYWLYARCTESGAHDRFSRSKRGDERRNVNVRREPVSRSTTTSSS